MTEAPRILLEHHLKRRKLPTFLQENDLPPDRLPRSVRRIVQEGMVPEWYAASEVL